MFSTFFSEFTVNLQLFILFSYTSDKQTTYRICDHKCLVTFYQ